jgi:dTDP-4-amino-4,6-dideoxygalactose transaminase
MPPSHLAVDLSAPPDVPDTAVDAALALLRGGWLHRYGETLGDSSDAALLEQEFAALLGARYCVGVNSCGSAMFLALLGSGVRPGDPVLMNGFTLSPVPGAIVHAGAAPVTTSRGRRRRQARGTCCCRTCAATSPIWTG